MKLIFIYVQYLCKDNAYVNLYIFKKGSSSIKEILINFSNNVNFLLNYRSPQIKHMRKKCGKLFKNREQSNAGNDDDAAKTVFKW